jgi:hypothetical protein
MQAPTEVRFEPGMTYFATSACRHDCTYTITILSRTEKMVTYMDDDRRRRSKLRHDNDGEYIIPEMYSMAPVFRAKNQNAG